MEIRRNLFGFLIFIWVAGLVVALSIGLGLRFGIFGWRRHVFIPGEEVVLFTGKHDGIFCETVMLQSSGYITGQNVFVRDWQNFQKSETKVDHLDVRLSDVHYFFRKYRLYTKDYVDVRVCSEYGLTVFIATTLDAFNLLTENIQRGKSCTNTPSATDPVCGKTVHTYVVGGTGSCNWSPEKTSENHWLRAYFVADHPTDAFVVFSSDPQRNRGKNLAEIIEIGKTYRSTAIDVISECIQQHMCMMQFDFAASQAVVIQIGSVDEDPTTNVEIWTYCQARDWFFVLLFCICPIILLSIVSFIVVRRFSPKHNLRYS